MMNEDDKDVRDWISKLSEVPFGDSLKSKILTRAQMEMASETKMRRWRDRHSLGRYFGVASGVVAACLIVVALVTQISLPHGNTTATSQHVPFDANATEFGLQNAPVQISDIHIGTIAGDPTNADVLATVKNTSQSPISEADLFGVLSFTPTQSQTENWLTFVNGPSGVIQPGQTVAWHFHPSGQALHAKGNDALIETPHLKFYTSALVSPATADAVWKKSALQVADIQPEPRNLGGGSQLLQSVQINAQIRNTTNRPIDLSKERAIIWFALTPDQSFLSDASIRFLYHLTPEYAGQHWPTIVEPGQTIDVNFPVLSDSKSDFFNRVAHVVIIDAPDVVS